MNMREKIARALEEAPTLVFDYNAQTAMFRVRALDREDGIATLVVRP